MKNITLFILRSLSIGGLITILIASSLISSWAQDTWVQKANLGGTARAYMVGFSIGNKGYAGTGSNGSVTKKDFWEYDPVTDAWTQKADFGGIARYAATGFSIGSKGYIGTGANYNSELEKDFWEYNPVSNVWTKKADFGGTPRAYATGFSISSIGYIGTGQDANGYQTDFWEYFPDTDSWSQKASVGGPERISATGFSIGTKGYIGTGRGYPGWFNDFWEYDPSSDAWTQKADFGGNGRQGAVGFNIGSKGYIGTGYNFGVSYGDFWEYDPIVNIWTQKASFEGAVRLEAVGFSIGSKGYIGTGWTGPGSIAYNDFWEYTPDGAVTCSIPTSLSAANITPTSATLHWDAVPGAIGYRVRYKAAGTSQWTLILSTDNQETITGLTPDTKYGWQVRTVCNQSPVVSSDSAAQDRFTTSPLRSEGGMFGNEGFAEVYPNPVQNELTIKLATPAIDVTIRIYDLQGKMIGLPTTIQNTQAQINTKALPYGFYTLQITNNKTGKSEVRKFVKQ